MKLFNPSVIGNAFVFAIRKPFAHLGKLLLALLGAFLLQIIGTILLLLPMSVITFYVLGYETTLVNFITHSQRTASFFAAMFVVVGWLRFYGLMYDNKPLHTYVFLLSDRLFAKTYLLLPLTLPAFFVFSQRLFVIAKVESFLHRSAFPFAPMFLITTLVYVAFMYWAAIGQFTLLEIIEGTPTKDAIRNAFHLTHRNLFTVLLYETTIVLIGIALFILLLKFFSSSISFLPFMILRRTLFYYLKAVITPASLVYLYKRLKGVNSGSETIPESTDQEQETVN